MNSDPDTENKRDPGKKNINVDALEDQVADLLKGTDEIDTDSLGLSEDLKRRLNDADAGELASIERELGISADDDIIQTVTGQTGDDEFDFGEIEDQTIEVEEKVVVEEKRDGKADIVIAEDKMSASISLFPSKGTGRPLNISIINKEINSLNIVYGLNNDLLKELVVRVEKSKTEKIGVIFAQGIPPREGKDGAVEYNFSKTEDVLKEQEGYVDNKPAPGVDMENRK